MFTFSRLLMIIKTSILLVKLENETKQKETSSDILIKIELLKKDIEELYKYVLLKRIEEENIIRCKHCGKVIKHYSGNLWHEEDCYLFPQYCQPLQSQLHEPKEHEPKEQDEKHS